MKKTEYKSRPNFLGIFLWLCLFLFISILLVVLFLLFPDQKSSKGIYLEIARAVGILALVSSGLIYARRLRLGEAVRNASIWLCIAGVILLVYTYRLEVWQIMYRVVGELIPGLATPLSPREIIITSSENGHFYVNGRANGKPLRFIVDTGASDITLSPQAAIQIGIDLTDIQYNKRYRTANGTVLGAPYRLESLSIGPFEFVNVNVTINQAELPKSLLGVSLLKRFESFEFRGSKLYLRK